VSLVIEIGNFEEFLFGALLLLVDEVNNLLLSYSPDAHILKL
jgi:hypothetical protein